MFFYFESYNPVTKRTERFARSVMSDSDWTSTEKASEFLQIIAGYLAQCGLEMPSSEEFKAVRDGARDAKPEPIAYPENKLGEQKF